MKKYDLDQMEPHFQKAYLSNGCIGLRIGEFPFQRGEALVNGFVGKSAEKGHEEYAEVPWPLGLDFQMGAIYLSKRPDLAAFKGQSYDHSCGELTSRFEIPIEGGAISVETLTFCSRNQPSLVCQETTLTTTADTELTVHTRVESVGFDGAMQRITRPARTTEGILHWQSRGNLSELGIAYATECLGPESVEPCRNHYGHEEDCLLTFYPLKLKPGQTWTVRKLTTLVPSCRHEEPHWQANRLLGYALFSGFDELRADNRAIWADLWKGRVQITADDSRWQETADAAFFYLHSSVHASSPHSVGPFGLSQRTLYSGHVFWDTETYMFPATLFTQPEAAKAMMDYRTACLPRAADNARLHGYRGLHFPWQSGATGGEVVPYYGHGGYLEHHVQYDIALAFSQYGHTTGDPVVLREQVWPVLKGVAEWTASRVKKTDRGYEIRHVTGIDEAMDNVHNNSFTNMGAAVCLREAINCAKQLGITPPAIWQRIADHIVLPIDPKTQVMLKHDGYEYKGGMCVPETLAGFFPFNYPADPTVVDATMKYHFDLADTYLGMPMLSSLFGVWACRQNDRALAKQLFEKGIMNYRVEPFFQFCEQSADLPFSFLGRSTGDTVFLTNPAGYLMALMMGLSGMVLDSGSPEGWFKHSVVLPEGMERIEVERMTVRGEERSLIASQDTMAKFV